MATTKNFLNTTELDFTSLRDSLKTFLSQQDTIRDYDYEGSNIAVLLDLLAYNGYLNAQYLNMIGSEMWVDTAQLRDSMFSHAKELNYVPRSKTSARATVTFTIDTGSDLPSSVTIPKHTQVKSSVTDSTGSEKQYVFVTYDDVVVRANEFGDYVSANVDIYEGRVVKEVFVVNSTSKYVLQSANADVESIRVNVQSSNSDFSNTDYTRSYNLYGVTSDDEVFFVQGAYDGRYEVTFGDGTVGVAPQFGNLVKVTYRDNTGPEANGVRRFTVQSQVEGYDVTSVDTVVASYGGADEESVESIRFNAPRYFTTQERAVVKSDYENMVRIQFPQLQAVAVYGGEEVTPKRYGKVIITAKPSGGEVMSDRLKSDVVAFLTGKNVVTEPVIVDAEFMYVKVTSTVYYDASVTNKNASQIAALAHDAATEYASGSADDFGATLRLSKMQTAIDACDSSVVSNDTRFVLEKRWKPKTGSTQSTVFTFGNELRSDVRHSDTENHDPIVYTSEFEYRASNVTYTSVVKDDGAGALVLYSVQDDGTQLLLDGAVGTVDYDTGDVTLSVNAYSYDSYVKIYAEPEKRDVSVRANVYLSISDVAVTATEE